MWYPSGMASQPPGPWTVSQLLNWTKEYFARVGLDGPRLSAEVLLAHVLGCRRIDLYARFEHQPTQEQRAAFRRLVLRAARDEPVAYLTGRKEFYSLEFRVTPDVLVPRPETEILVDQAVEHLRRLGRPGRAWDVCTGSGCVAVAVAAQVPGAMVLATDICPAAVDLAAENARSHGLAERVRCRKADLLTLPDGSRDMAPLDVITANPPYVAVGAPVAEDVKHEPQVALDGGPDGLESIRRIVRDAPQFLRPGGRVVMEFGYDQADAVRELIAAGGRFERPRVFRDHQHIERAVTAVRRAEA